MDLLDDVGQVEAHFGLFGDILISRQDRCTVCAKCIIALKWLWAHQTVLLGGVDQVEDPFYVFGDIVNLDAR
jgi:hypothetical protein